MPFPFMAAALLGGAALGAGGGFLSGQSANRAGRQARDFFDMRTGQQQRRLGLMAMGQDWEDLFNGTGFNDAASRDRFLAKNPPIFGQMDALVSDANKRGEDAISEYGRTTGRLDALARGNEDLAAEFGAAGEGVIRTNTAKNLKAANQMAAGQLGMLGANTLLANQTSANARNASDAETAALVNLMQQRTGMMMGARGDRLSMLSDRDKGFTTLRQGSIDRRLNAGMMPLNARLALLSGATMNPWSNNNASAYYPGASGAGNAAGSAGNLLSSLGGLYMAKDFFGQGGNGSGV